MQRLVLPGLVGALVVGAGCPARGRPMFEPVEGIGGVARGYGAGWGDVDGDGFPDLYVNNHAGQPNLYVSNGDGTFTDEAARWMPDRPSTDAHAVCFVDYDGDGRVDLFETTGATGSDEGPHHLWHNEGDHFVDAAFATGLAAPGARGRTALFFDLESDGDLDAFLHHEPRPDLLEPNGLYRNEYGVFFRDDVSGMERFDRAAFTLLADLTADDRLDVLIWTWLRGVTVYVAHKGSLRQDPRLIVPLSGNDVTDALSFDADGDLVADLLLLTGVSAQVPELWQPSESALLAVFAPLNRTMGVDFRGPDVIEVSIETTKPGRPLVRAGAAPAARVSTLTVRAADLPEGEIELPDARGGALSVGRVDGTWQIRGRVTSWDHIGLDVRGDRPLEAVALVGAEHATADPTAQPRLIVRGEQVASGILTGAACPGGAVGDFDNDQDQDVFLLCSSNVRNLADRLFLNDGSGRFREASRHGAEGSELLGRSGRVAVADYDRDGFLDLFVDTGADLPPNAAGPKQLFRNLGNGNHWIELELVGRPSNVGAIGAVVELTAGGVTQKRWVTGGQRPFVTDDDVVHFGLARNRSVERVVVTWPSGRVQEWLDLPADRLVALEEAVD